MINKSLFWEISHIRALFGAHPSQAQLFLNGINFYLPYSISTIMDNANLNLDGLFCVSLFPFSDFCLMVFEMHSNSQVCLKKSSTYFRGNIGHSSPLCNLILILQCVHYCAKFSLIHPNFQQPVTNFKNHNRYEFHRMSFI